MTTYHVGDRARLTLALTDIDGVAANGTVVLTVTDPAGTATTPAVTNTATGAYRADVDVDQEGRWTYLWTSTGAVIAAEPGEFHVEAASSQAVITLADAKTHLNISGTGSDDELRPFLRAATEFVEHTVGAVVRQTKTEVHTPSGDGFVWLNHPAISLTSVTETYGSTTSWVAADVTTDSPELSKGLLWLGSSYVTSTYPVKVTYVAGRTVVPDLIRSAALDYVKWDWQSQRGASPLPFGAAEELSLQPGTVPFKIRQKLAPYASEGMA